MSRSPPLLSPVTTQRTNHQAPCSGSHAAHVDVRPRAGRGGTLHAPLALRATWHWQPGTCGDVPRARAHFLLRLCTSAVWAIYKMTVEGPQLTLTGHCGGRVPGTARRESTEQQTTIYEGERCRKELSQTEAMPMESCRDLRPCAGRSRWLAPAPMTTALPTSEERHSPQLASPASGRAARAP